MKFYISGKATESEQVADIIKKLEAIGHEVTFNWTIHDSAKPYLENINKAAKYASWGINGVTDADVFVLLANAKGRGLFTELGAALAMLNVKENFRVFVIGEENKAHAIFYHHPDIEWLSNVEELFEKINN